MDRGCWSAVLTGLLLVTAGCKMQPKQSVDAASAVSYQRHSMRGMVLGKSSLTGQVTVQQEAIPDFMPAMNATYRISDPAQFRQLQPGDQIAAEILSPSTGAESRLRNISVMAQPAHPMTPAELPPHRLLMGEAVPDIPMTDQDGQAVHFPQFHGKAVLVTFIDSKCKDDCPVITGLFQKVNMLLEESPQSYAASHLLTISIDPANDTPPVLRRYGLKYLDGDAKGFSHWGFVDLTPANLKKLATAFDVVYRKKGNDIEHTMITALISPSGTLQQVWSGDQWKPQEVAQAVEYSAAGSAGRL